MRNLFKSAFAIIKNNIFLNILVIAQLIIAVFLVNSLVGLFVSVNYQQNIVEKVTDDSLFFFYPKLSYGLNFDYAPPLGCTSYSVTESGATVNEKNILINAFDSALFDHFDFPLARGRWFTNEPSDEIETVVTANLNLKINDTFQVYMQTDGVPVPKNAKVVGVLPPSFMTFNLKSCSKDMTLDNLLCWGGQNIEDAGLQGYMLMNDRSIDKNALSTKQWGRFLILSETLTSAEKDSIMDALLNDGSVRYLLEMKENSANLLKQNLIVGVPFSIFTLLLTFLSFWIILLFINNGMTNYFSILFLTGAKWRTIQGGILTYCFIVSVITMLITLLCNIFLVNPYNDDLSVTNILYSFISLLVLLTFFTLCTVFMQKRTFHKEQLIECLRRSK